MLKRFNFKVLFQINTYNTKLNKFVRCLNRPPKPIHSYDLLKRVEYHEIKNEFYNLIKKISPKYFFMDIKSVNPLPIVISKSQINEYGNIQEALLSAIQVIVLNYFKDTRIQSALKLESKVKAILELYRYKTSYQIGSYRPDFLHEKETLLPKFCEINARFTTNGFFLTQYGCQALEECQYLNSLKKNKSLKKIQNINEVTFSFEKRFDTKKTIGILLGREKCHDLNILHDSIKNTVFLKPTDLNYDKNLNNLYYLNENNEKKYIDQFIIELHQDEIVDMPFQIIKCFVNSCTILNDLRTIFIIHNKRLLSLLSDDAFLSDYLSETHQNNIRKHRILSILPEKLQFETNLYNKIIKQKEDWLIKPSLFGKGEGIIFGKNLDEKEWDELINKCILNPNHFLIQKYVEQESFSIYHEEKLADFKIAGSLLCFDTRFLGPGIFRSSNKDLISLSQGGFILYPIEGHCPSNDTIEINSLSSQKPKLMESDKAGVKSVSKEKKNSKINNFRQLRLPSDALFKVSKFSFEKISSIETALLKHGIALLSLNFEDSESVFFSALVNQIGIPLAHSSKNDDFLWHIKANKENGIARSHSQNIFEMHTDASFESIPPRYIGMQVIQEDNFDGGQSLFLNLNDILKDLNEKEIHLLQTTMLKFRKPLEFYKTGENFTEGPILSLKRDKFNNLLCRYRNDIILNRNEINKESKEALKKFESLIDLEKSKKVEYYFLRKNSILLLDNCRYLHGRTKVNDPNRHLTRMRFQTKYEELIPIF